MKKLSFLFFFLLSSPVFSQSMLGEGGKQLNAGVGVSSWGLPVYIGFDFGVHKDVSLGFEASYRSYRHHFAGYYYHHTVFGLCGNANYHFNSLLNMPQKFDLYAGLNVGFYLWDSDEDSYGGESNGLGLGGQVGFRYYFNERFAINIEAGSGNAFSGGKLGITYKF